MKAKKVLNNSLILVEEDGQEIILMGKGIGYQLSTGMSIDESKIEKKFVNSDIKTINNFAQLAQEIDEAYFELTHDLIRYAEEKYGLKLSEYLYVALSDHISYAVQRAKEGVIIKTIQPVEFQKFHPKEWELGKLALQKIREQFDVELPIDEAATIALHFVNAQKEKRYDYHTDKINKIVNDSLSIIQYHFKIAFDKESIQYIRAVSHLQLFAQRLLEGKLLPNEKNPFLYEHIMSTCKPESDCVQKINKYISTQFDSEMTNQEEMYLVLHIHRLLEHS